MASKTDLRSYFKRKAEESKPASKKVKLASPEIIVSASENVNPAEIEIAKDEVKKSVRAETLCNHIRKHSKGRGKVCHGQRYKCCH